MNGVYKDYVILASLPQNGNYRITEHTNALDSKTYEAVANNLIDSGHTLPSGNGLNGISTTKYATATTESLNNDTAVLPITSTSRSYLIIGIASGGILILLIIGVILYKKHKNEE